MQHNFYASGNPKKISWVLKNDESTSEQFREHVEMYKDNITDEQSKYIAIHVGIFWGIGTFRIKNEDSINIILDSENMVNDLRNGNPINDELISKRIISIKQLIAQRKLEVTYNHSLENLATKLIT